MRFLYLISLLLPMIRSSIILGADLTFVDAETIEGLGDESITSVLYDTQGNRYIAGHKSTGLQIGTTYLTGYGDRDFWAGKQSATGQWLWAIAGCGSGQEALFDSALDQSGFWYLGISYWGTCNLDEFSMTSRGSSDIAIIKISQTGDIIRVVTGGSTNVELIYGLTISPNQHLSVIGQFNNTLELAGQILVSSGSSDIMIFQLDLDGNLRRITKGGSISTDLAGDISSDYANNIVIGGSIGAGSFDIQGFSVISSGSRDMMIASLNDSGIIQWIKRGGGANSDSLSDIATDGVGNIYAVGMTQSLTGSYGTSQYIATSVPSFVLQSYSPQGNLRWLKQYPIMPFVLIRGWKLSVDEFGNSFIAGSMSGSRSLSGVSLSASGSTDAFLGRRYPDGTFAHAIKGGGTGADAYHSVGFDGNQTIIAGGSMSSAGTFGSGIINALSGTDGAITRHDREYLYHCSQISPVNVERNQGIFNPLCIYVGPGMPIIPSNQGYPLSINYVNTSINNITGTRIVMFIPHELPNLLPAQTGSFTAFVIPFKSYTGYRTTQ